MISMRLCSLTVTSLFFSVHILHVTGNFICPELEGLFPDERQCDKYYDCKDGQATEILCPDGLVFDPNNRRREPCDYFFVVDCGTREKLQPQRGITQECPRLNGAFASPDPQVCDLFYTCVDGIAELFTCNAGLWFDEYQGICNWPVQTVRRNCTSEHMKLDSGFRCPAVEPATLEGGFGITDPHPKFADPSDCAKFYICMNGISPRIQGCEKGLVFNVQTKQCDVPENVPECKDYYAFLNEPDLAVASKGLNRARRR